MRARIYFAASQCPNQLGVVSRFDLRPFYFPILGLLMLALSPCGEAQLSTDVAALAVKGSLKQPEPADGLVSDPTLASVLPYEPKPAVGDNAFITARISNAGTALIPSVQVSFFENGTPIETISADFLLPGETRNVTSPW